MQFRTEEEALLRRQERKRKAKPRYEREKACDMDFAELCRTPPDDPEAALVGFLVQQGGLHGTRQRVFRRSGNEETYETFAAIRGKSSKRGAFVGGPLGRLRAQAGEPLELRRIGLNELAEIAYLEYDVCAQFDKQKVGISFNALAKKVDGGLWGVFDRGRISGRNHFHIFVKPGTCKLGVSNGIIPDSRLVIEARYLLKPPVWESDVEGEPWYANLLALYLVKLDNPGKHIATRVSHRGLGNARTRPVSFQRTLDTFGDYILSKPSIISEDLSNLARQAVKEDTQAPVQVPEMVQKVEPETWRNASETWRIAFQPSPLPTLRHSSPEINAQLGEVHRAWLAGNFDGKPGRIGIGRTDDLGEALGRYFTRSWLSGGEAADLCQVEALPQVIPLQSQHFGQAVAV